MAWANLKLQKLKLNPVLKLLQTGISQNVSLLIRFHHIILHATNRRKNKVKPNSFDNSFLKVLSHTYCT